MTSPDLGCTTNHIATLGTILSISLYLSLSLLIVFLFCCFLDSDAFFFVVFCLWCLFILFLIVLFFFFFCV